MRISNTVASVLAHHRLNAVLVDVGASGGAPDIWKPLASQATYVGFDPDLREIRTDTAGGYRTGIIINKAVCADPSSASVPFFLTESPYCSSMLRPDERALSMYSFASLFRVTQTTSVPATTLNKVVEEHALGQIDWLKMDAQGADLRIYDSLTAELRNRLLAIDTEPGLIDAYQNEDLFIDVHRRLRADGFWLSHVEIRGVPRISQSVLAELGIETRSGIPDSARAHLRSSPGWCEARYLRTVESLKDRRLGERETVLAWAFAMVDGQYGHALEIAQVAKRDFNISAHAERLWVAASEALKGDSTSASTSASRSWLASAAIRKFRALGRLLVR